MTEFDVFALPVHPAADRYPMMPDEDLAELVERMREHGYRAQHPLVLIEQGGELMLLDGRNRREAARLAGVTPATTMLNGEDPIDYVLDANNMRRHMTKGQLAMVAATLRPEPEKGGRGKNVSKFEGFASGYLSNARTVLAYMPELVDEVVAGTTPLHKAYAEAKEIKDKRDGAPARRKAMRQRLEREAPDLLCAVEQKDMELEQAIEALKERLEEERVHRAGIGQMLGWMESAASIVCNESQMNRTKDYLLNHWDEHVEYRKHKNTRAVMLRALEDWRAAIPELIDLLSRSKS